MSKLIFTDGMTFDTSGPLRTEERSDGWYVVGEGLLMAVKSQDEGLKFIENKNETKWLQIILQAGA